MTLDWNKETETKFEQMIDRVPGPMQTMAREMVAKKAQELAEKENEQKIGEKHLIDAFFEVTPFGFHGPMKTDMETIGLDYTQYGHEK